MRMAITSHLSPFTFHFSLSPHMKIRLASEVVDFYQQQLSEHGLHIQSGNSDGAHVLVVTSPTKMPKSTAVRYLQAEFRLCLRKTIDRELEVILGVSSRNLGPDSSGALWYHGIKETDHIQAKFQQAISDFLSQCSLTDHNRHNRMLSRANG